MTVSLPRFAGRTAIVLGAVCTLGIWPVHLWESTQGVVAWSVAFVVALIGAILGAIPLASKFARQSPENFPQAWLIGLGIRMLFVLTACLVVWVTRPFVTSPFLLGAGVAYGVVLGIEIATASRMMTVVDVPVTTGDVSTPIIGVAASSRPVAGDLAR